MDAWNAPFFGGQKIHDSFWKKKWVSTPGRQFELMTQHNPQQHEPYILESFFTPSPKEKLGNCWSWANGHVPQTRPWNSSTDNHNNMTSGDFGIFQARILRATWAKLFLPDMKGSLASPEATRNPLCRCDSWNLERWDDVYVANFAGRLLHQSKMWMNYCRSCLGLCCGPHVLHDYGFDDAYQFGCTTRWVSMRQRYRYRRRNFRWTNERQRFYLDPQLAMVLSLGKTIWNPTIAW